MKHIAFYGLMAMIFFSSCGVTKETRCEGGRTVIVKTRTKKGKCKDCDSSSGGETLALKIKNDPRITFQSDQDTDGETAIDTDDDTDGGETATFKPNQPASSSSLTTVESGDNAPKKRSSKITVGIPIVSKPVAPSRPLVTQVSVTTNPKSKPAPPKTTTNEPRNVPPSTSSADTRSEQIMKKDRPKPKKKWAG